MSDVQHTAPEQGYDRDINLKGILVFAGGVIAAIVIAALAMWGMSIALRGQLTDADPEPSVIPEAQQPYEPPGPGLQNEPEHELQIMRAEEEAILSSYAWVDEAAGVAQIPVERAITILVETAADDVGEGPRLPARSPAGAGNAPSPDEVETEDVGEDLASSRDAGENEGEGLAPSPDAPEATE